VLALLAEGTIVSIDGPPVDGFYPVTAENLSGWMRGETVQLEKDTPEPDGTEGTEVDPLVDATDELASVEAPAELEPATDAAADTAAAPEEAIPVAEPSLGEEAVPIAEPVSAEELPPTSESAPVAEVPPEDAATVAPAPELDSSGAPLPVVPDGESAPSESVPTTSDMAVEPPMDSNVTPIPVVEVSPVGPASVSVDAPIRTGPGPRFELIVTAPMGSAVEQTGHVIDGYVTVQYAEATGWVALEHLGVPGAFVEEPPVPETTAPTKTSPVEPLPAETPLAETAPAEGLLIEAPPAEAPPAETAPTEAASPETPPAETLPPESSSAEIPPAEAAPAEAAEGVAMPVEVAPVDAT